MTLHVKIELALCEARSPNIFVKLSQSQMLILWRSTDAFAKVRLYLVCTTNKKEAVHMNPFGFTWGKIEGLELSLLRF